MTRYKDIKVEKDKNIEVLIGSGADGVCVVGKSSRSHVEKVIETSMENNLAMISDTIKYLNLTRMSQHKVPALEVNEDLFMSVGKIEYKRLQKVKYGDFARCHITLKPMPNGIFCRDEFLTFRKLT